MKKPTKPMIYTVSKGADALPCWAAVLGWIALMILGGWIIGLFFQ